jgi:ribosomal protein S18 acetylase RimI-like enzyme
MSQAQVARIRPATEADLDQIVELWFELMEHHRRINDRFWQPAPDAAEKMRSWLGEAVGSERRRLLVAEVDGQVAGFIHGQMAGGPPPVTPRRDGEITDLFVRPAYRRQGLAGGLVRALTDWFAEQGAERVTLAAAVDNPEAVGFWRALGFDAFLYRMWKPLT